jgi:toxin ParE1/3/4
LKPVQEFPLAGAPRDYLAVGLRVTFHERYAIYYRAGPDAVVVIRVLHGARDVTKLIEPDESP